MKKDQKVTEENNPVLESRRNILKKSVQLGLLTSAASLGLNFVRPGHAEAQEKKPEFTWVVQTAWPAGYALNDLHWPELDLIEGLSGGRIKIKRHTGGEIVPPYQVWESVSKGVIDGGFA